MKGCTQTLLLRSFVFAKSTTRTPLSWFLIISFNSIVKIFFFFISNMLCANFLRIQG